MAAPQIGTPAQRWIFITRFPSMADCAEFFHATVCAIASIGALHPCLWAILTAPRRQFRWHHPSQFCSTHKPHRTATSSVIYPTHAAHPRYRINTCTPGKKRFVTFFQHVAAVTSCSIWTSPLACDPSGHTRTKVGVAKPPVYRSATPWRRHDSGVASVVTCGARCSSGLARQQRSTVTTLPAAANAAVATLSSRRFAAVRLAHQQEGVMHTPHSSRFAASRRAAACGSATVSRQTTIGGP
jgi:hypothetical protein